MSISNKIYNIFNRLKESPYTGNIRCHHFSVAIRSGKQISPISYNYYRHTVLGKVRGTMHAEMGSLTYILNTDRSNGCYNNHKSLKGIQPCILRGKQTKKS